MFTPPFSEVENENTAPGEGATSVKSGKAAFSGTWTTS